MVISAELVRQLVEEKIEGTDIFIIDIQVRSSNAILIEVDADQGLPIDACVGISRHVERSFDREEQDFELSVSSPGVNQPLKMTRQYLKNIGRQLKVTLEDDKHLEGVLHAANEEGIELMTRVKERLEGRKKKVWVETNHALSYDTIKEARIVVSFN